MFPSQAYAEAAWANPDADIVWGARLGEDHRPKVREDPVPHELHGLPPCGLSLGAKIT